MTETLPQLTYGTITGRFVTAIGDTVLDGDYNPEEVPMSGSVTFTPSMPVTIVDTATPVGVTMAIAPVTVSLDTNGYLQYNSVQYVKLLATNNTALNPTGFTWTVDYSLVYSLNGSTTKVNLPSSSFALPAGSTIDLRSVLPVPSNPGTPTTVGRGVPAGGTTGQVLAKIDGTDYNTQWVAQSGGSGTPTDGSVTTAKLADGSVTSAKIVDGSIVDGDISGSAAIAQAKIVGLATLATTISNIVAELNLTPPVVTYTGTAWPSRASRLTGFRSGYTGKVYFDSADYSGIDPPTDMAVGDRLFDKVSP